MRRRRFRFLPLLVLILGAGIAWLSLRKPEKQAIILPGGSRLTLVKATYGGNHSCSYGNGWREWIYPLLPHRFRTNFTAKVATLTSTDTNGVVIWLLQTGTPPTNIAQVLLPFRSSSSRIPTAWTVLSVADGQVLESQALYATAEYDVNPSTQLFAYELGNHPRRAKQFAVPVYLRRELGNDGRRTTLVGRFILANRKPREFPTWTPEPLPVTKRTNQLELTMLKFETGLTEADSRMYAHVGDGARAFSCVTFLVTENGSWTKDWDFGEVRLTSATGERWYVQARRSWGQGVVSFDFLGSLWDEEPAFLLQVALHRLNSKTCEFQFQVKPDSIKARSHQ